MSRPMVIGVCGPIGSGKSVVRRTMELMYGYPTFDSDEEAKRLYLDPDVRREVSEQLGFDPIVEQRLNKQDLDMCLREAGSKKILERIIHSALEVRWGRWLSRHEDSPAVVLESAILYTSGYYRHCDRVIAVTAPVEVRRARVLKRDGAGRSERFEAIERMQMEERQYQASRAEYHVDNTDECSIVLQIEQLKDTLLSN